MRKKIAMGAAAGIGLAGVGMVTTAAPAGAYCNQRYDMMSSLGGSYRYGPAFDSNYCNGNYDVEFSRVSETGYYHAHYQNSSGGWVAASVNSQNNGLGAQINGGYQNPFKKMITDLPNGRGVYMGVRSSNGADGTVWG